jgi:antitoxin PrlF
VTVTTKGQVTVPKPVRDLLGIVPSSTVAFELAQDGRVFLTKVDRDGGHRVTPERSGGASLA